ncbi:MAG: hypothetical protein LBC45_00945 [Chlamydiales bacterium]|nr:hypothetical protein [Chlamydiales bacterium]
MSSIFPVTLGKVVICDKKYGVIMDCTITQSQKIYKDFVNQIANEGWSNIHAIIAHKDP